MRLARFLGAVALATSLTGCFPELDDVSTERVQLRSHVTDWRDEVIYQLLVDRFADGDTGNDFRVDRTALGHYQGGDWQGVIDNLDYLQTLGVTTLWISPVVRNVDHDAGFDAYHGYWAQDLTLLNPHFGDLATLRRLVNACHARGIKVIVDIVTNHMGQMFYYDVNNNGRPDDFIEGSGPDYPYRNPGGVGSTLRRVTEYDPDYNDRGPVQAFTSLGPAGPAPVVFLNLPDIFRVPPRSDILESQSILARPEGYHRRGRITSYDNVNNQPGEQTLLGDFPGGLKDVATELPEVRRAMIEAYWRWVELTDIDGFRIDTLKHVEHEFWTSFTSGFTYTRNGREVRVPGIRDRARARGKANFLLFGEAFDGDDVLVGSYTNVNEMDSVFYFPQKYRIFDNIFQCGAGDTSDLERLLTERQRNYRGEPQPNGVPVAPRSLLVNFMDNHDVSRFLYGMNPTVVADIRRGEGRDCSSGIVGRLEPAGIQPNPADVERLVQRLHAALTFLLTEDGIPCIYYGTEQEFQGGNDPSNRERMWETRFRTRGRTFDWVRRLIRVRKTYPALRRGSITVAWTTPGSRAGAEREDTGMLAFERADGDQYALVVIHAHGGDLARTRHMGSAMRVNAPPGTELVNILGDGTQTVTVGGDGRATVELGPWQSAVFVPRAQVRELVAR